MDSDSTRRRPREAAGPGRSVGLHQAMEATSTPGGPEPLGVETDLALRYKSRDGLVAGLQYGLLVPLAGLDNPALQLDAAPAQRVHAMLAWLF